MVPSTSKRRALRRRAVTSILATETVRDVARTLAQADIEILPFKGALYQHWLYEDPAERAMTDVDVLVLPRQLRVAHETLVGAGYEALGRSSIGAHVLKSPSGLALDLHPRLFDSARYRLRTEDVFARSASDTTTFEAPVRVPFVLDAYAHAIGKFGSDHSNASAEHRLDEILRISMRIDQSADIAASHLVACGMRRVARYVLDLLSEARNDRFARQVLARLPADPTGQVIAVGAQRVLSHTGPHSNVAALAAHLLNDSIPRGVVSGLRAAAGRVRQRS
jgi:hypothetical protein